MPSPTSRLKFVAAALCLCLPNMSLADQMVLTMDDKSFAFRGEFVKFDQDAYLIRTQAGEIYVPASLVSCEGVDCLHFEPSPLADIRTASLALATR